jgi:NADH-quinone oxidoreductase subunit G
MDFRFKSRTWFLAGGDSICPYCGRGCSIKIDFNSHFHRFPIARRVFRVQARANPAVNGHWICDLGRYGYKYLDEDRLNEIQAKNELRKLSNETLPHFLAERLNRLRYMNRTSQIAVVLNSWLSNEELFLLKKIFCEDLNIKKIFFADPPKGEADGFLLTSDRSPNRRGAEEIGFSLEPPNWEALSDKTDLLLIFGSFLASMKNPGELKALMDQIPTTLLLAPHKSEMDSLVDLVLPTATIAEKSGSLTNCDGIIQPFLPVFEPPGDSRAEWRFLVDLAKKLGSDFQYFSRFVSPPAILKQMGREIPFFERQND